MAICSAVESQECEAPAGWRVGSGLATNKGVPRRDLLTCGYCNEPVCKACSSEVDGKPVCLSHGERELLWWMGMG